MYLSSLLFDHWKSLQGRVSLTSPSRVAQLIGPTGGGKTSTLQGISFVLGAGVPGVGRADQPGELLDLVRGGDRGAVEATFDEAPGLGRLTARRALRATKSGGTQEFRCSPGPVASTQNKDHEEFARQYLGDFPIMIDPMRLPAMKEADQRLELLRLSGGLQGITVEKVAATIRDMLPELTDDDLVDLGLAVLSPSGDLEPSPAVAAITDPLDALALIVDVAHRAELAREKEAKVARTASKVTPPDHPKPSEGEAARLALIAAETEADRLREAKGALQERRRLIAEQQAAAKAAEQAANEERAQRHRELTQSIRVLEEKLATPAGGPAQGGSAATPPTGPSPALAAAQKRLVDLQQEFNTTDWAAPQTRASETAQAAHAAAEQEREARATAEALRRQHAQQLGVVQTLDQQAVALAPGLCPTCEQVCHAQHGNKLSALNAARAALAAIDARLAPAVAAEQQAKVAASQYATAAAGARNACDAANRRYAFLQAEIAKAKTEIGEEQRKAERAAEAAERQRLTAAQARTVAEQQAAEARAAAEATLREKRAQLAQLPPPTTTEPLVDQTVEIDAQLAELAGQIETAEQAEAAARAELEAWQAADKAALDARREIERAKEEARRLTSRRDLMRRLQDVAQQIEARILGEAIDPLVGAVRREIGEDPSTGSFVADLSAGGCRLGFLRTDAEGNEYFVRLRRGVCSEGEVVIFSLALAAALVELRKPVFPIALIDSTNDMDPGIQAGLLDGVVGLVRRGVFHQAIVAGHYPAPGFDYEAAGVALIDVTQAFQAENQVQAQAA